MVLLQLVFVAAYHGLRRDKATRADRDERWRDVYDIAAVLGHPPAPGPH